MARRTFKVLFYVNGSEYETLLKAFDRENEVFKKRVGKDRLMATYRARVRARNHVAAFIKSFYRRTDMSMQELTPDFIKGVFRAFNLLSRKKYITLRNQLRN